MSSSLQDLAQQNTLIEEMLHLIIMVVGESSAEGQQTVQPSLELYLQYVISPR